jgi:hypothetical protein
LLFGGLNEWAEVNARAIKETYLTFIGNAMRCLYFGHFRLQQLPPVFLNFVLCTLTAGCQCA